MKKRKKNPTAPLGENLNNRAAWRGSFISNTPVSHSTMMTDYKVFFLDYVPDENS